MSPDADPPLTDTVPPPTAGFLPTPDPVRGPLAARRPVRLAHRHGDRTDDYAWLRDDTPGEKRPEVMAQLRAENAWTEARTAHLAPLREALAAELRARIRDDDRSVPAHRDGWWYASRYDADAEHPVHVRWRGDRADSFTGGPAGEEQVLLDEQARAAAEPLFVLGDLAVSPDDRLVAWTEDTTGRRRHRLRVREIATGRDLPDVVDGVLEDFEWSADSRQLIYVRQHPQLLQSGPVCRHVLGTPAVDDALVFDEPDPAMYVSLSKTSSRAFVLITIEGDDSTELRTLPADMPEAAPTVLLQRKYGVRHEADHLHGRWVIRTNERARSFRLVEADPAAPADRRGWRVLVPARRDVTLEDFLLFDRAIVVQERADANLRLRVLPWRSEAAPAGAAVTGFAIAADEPAFTMALDDNPDPSAGYLRYAYTSMIAPMRIVDVDFVTGVRTVRREEPVAGYRPADYATARLQAPARDGTQVPVSIAWRRGAVAPGPGAAPGDTCRADLIDGPGAQACAADATPSAAGHANRRGGRPNGRAPARAAARAATLAAGITAPPGIRALLLTGYGAYGDAFDPQFDPDLVSLMDRGFAVAIVHVRGGLECGEDWYDGGRLQAKQNTFSDFIDATRWLVRRGWGPRDQVYAEGGSAGGLLMAAVANQAGSLYRGMLLQVPFVDVLTSMLDDTLPLTAQERCEWGDPRHAEDFAAMKAWSPYDNLKAREYPAMLVTAALHDAQVPVHEPAKYVARLRALKTDTRPLLLHVEFDAGHAGRVGRFERRALRALEFAFLLDLAGLAGRPKAETGAAAGPPPRAPDPGGTTNPGAGEWR